MANVTKFTREVITEVTESITITLSVREAQALTVILGNVDMHGDGIITSNIWDKLRLIKECKIDNYDVANGTIRFVKPLSDAFNGVSQT